MADEEKIAGRLKTLVLGGARSVEDRSIFHKLSLIAFFAWVGLGADGLSSSCYGPQAMFKALEGHYHLAIFVALATAVTIFVISSSYSQIIELFPAGGGGYLVASKLLSPALGAVAGCALLVDYVLTITISIAAGADAMFSFLPPVWHPYKLWFSALVVLAMMLINLRGVRESVAPLVPIFIIFVLTHAFVIVYAVVTHLNELASLPGQTAAEVQATAGNLGVVGMLVLLLHAYGMGAGTYTGIEAVSNGLPILREPRAQTGRRTMTYMWVSLSVAVLGLVLAFLLYRVTVQPGKTLNALLLEQMAFGRSGGAWPAFVWVTLLSETALLFVAAQTGFLDGPRVLANMATDRWFPTRLSMLSDRLVTQNGVLLMSLAAMVTLLASGGSVEYLVVLYSINVFITFVLSQSGMVRHWLLVRGQVKDWLKKAFINGVGLTLSALILVWMVILKFHEGGWATLVVTLLLVIVVALIRWHYKNTGRYVQRLDRLAQSMQLLSKAGEPAPAAQAPAYDRNAKSAIVLVSGFNGLGVHAVLNVVRFFGSEFKNFAFICVGVVDAGNFKGQAEIGRLREHVQQELDRYVQMMRAQGHYAESFHAIGTDIADEVEKLAPQVLERFPRAVFFAGQVIFPKESLLTRLLHNNIVFAVQQRLYRQGIPFVILPVRA